MAAISRGIAQVTLPAVGIVLLTWSLVAFLISWNLAPSSQVGVQIVGGDRFSQQGLEQVLSSIEGMQLPLPFGDARRSSALIQMRLYEMARERVDPEGIDAWAGRLNGAIRASLSVNPADAFLWFALFRIDGYSGGFQDGGIKYLARSYELGPREQWIAERRNRLALALFSQLDAASQDRVVAEFAGLFDANLFSLISDNLLGPGWPLRERLLGKLSDERPEQKLALKRYIGRRGFRVDIPGVVDLDPRPWQ